MKNLLTTALLLSTTLAVGRAGADDKATCLSAASKGQRFRDHHELVQARAQFRVCAASVCPGVVQSDCAGWLVEVEKALPSVVLAAKSEAGADLVDVKVSMDGQVLVTKLDGQAVTVDAGPHTFHFEGPEGATDRQAVVKEGEKNQAIAVVLGAPAATSRAGASDATAVMAPAPPPDVASGSGPLKTVGWVAGGLGAAGIVMGATFGTLAVIRKDSGHCVMNGCDPGTSIRGIRSAALLSDVGWIAGGVLLAGGAALVLLSRGGGHAGEAGVRVAPVVLGSGGGAVLGGSW